MAQSAPDVLSELGRSWKVESKAATSKEWSQSR